MEVQYKYKTDLNDIEALSVRIRKIVYSAVKSVCPTKYQSRRYVGDDTIERNISLAARKCSELHGGENVVWFSFEEWLLDNDCDMVSVKTKEELSELFNNEETNACFVYDGCLYNGVDDVFVSMEIVKDDERFHVCRGMRI